MFQVYSIVVGQSHTSLSNPSDISSTHLAPFIVITLLLTIRLETALNQWLILIVVWSFWINKPNWFFLKFLLLNSREWGWHFTGWQKECIPGRDWWVFYCPDEEAQVFDASRSCSDTNILWFPLTVFCSKWREFCVSLSS